MSDGRHTLTRKEPITVDVTGTGETITISPVPWRKRNELGTVIAQEFNNAFEKWKEARSFAGPEAFYDYAPVLRLGTELSDEQIDSYTEDEIVSICRWIVEQNGLQALLWMLDPEVPAPQSSLQPSGETPDGQKTPSTEDSSSQESQPEMLKN